MQLPYSRLLKSNLLQHRQVNITIGSCPSVAPIPIPLYRKNTCSKGVFVNNVGFKRTLVLSGAAAEGQSTGLSHSGGFESDAFTNKKSTHKGCFSCWCG